MLEKLRRIQTELKCAKNQYNSFGKYKYRSCEDILESVKPLLARENCVLSLSDSVEMIGDRFYIKATAKITDVESGASYEVAAMAREELNKKGQDSSQITGTASSYARKYALNGLFLIDDTKDADTDENRNERNGRQAQTASKQQTKTGRTNREKVIALARELNLPFDELMKDYGITKATTEERFAEILKDMEG